MRKHNEFTTHGSCVQNAPSAETVCNEFIIISKKVGYFFIDGFLRLRIQDATWARGTVAR